MIAASPVEIGSLLAGKYRIERVLGQGGMGVVVVAMHDELDQRVAIKFLHKESLADAEWIARFAREARAAARIKSEHAVKVYDVGKLENGAPYMVMEYLEGRDLQTILNTRTRLPVSEAVDYLLQACEAIAEAHGAGVVHRDLKPANLFVTYRTDGSSCVKILDFGISKMTSLTGGDQSVTNTAAIVGSPLYMSPEQMKASKNVDPRTDIWALGVILQEIVSGLPSFVANTTAELCALVLTAEPTPLRASLPDAPAGLDAVIARCLAKNPDQRYGSVAELARALERFGPPQVKTWVERITRMGSALSRAAEKAVEKVELAPVSIVPPGQTSSKISSLGQTELSDSGAPSASMRDVPARAQIPGSGTNAAWGSSQPVTRKSRLALVIAGSVAAALAVLAVIAVATSHSHSPTSVATTPPPPPTTTTAVTTVITTPTATTQATESPAVTTPVATTTQIKPTKPVHTTSPQTTATTKKTGTAPVDTTGFGGRN